MFKTNLFYHCMFFLNPTMDCVRVQLGSEAFWSHVRSLQAMGLITRTCKTLRAECDVAFAVLSMGLDRKISKAWAQRWLGLSLYWMYIAEKDMMLVMGLEILAAHGGMAVTLKRAIQVREKEEDGRRKKAWMRKDRATRD